MFVYWDGSQDNTWEDAASLLSGYPSLDLEDKVNLVGEAIVRNGPDYKGPDPVEVQNHVTDDGLLKNVESAENVEAHDCSHEEDLQDQVPTMPTVLRRSNRSRRITWKLREAREGLGSYIKRPRIC